VTRAVLTIALRMMDLPLSLAVIDVMMRLHLADELFLEPLVNITSCLLCCRVCVTGSIPGL
jgi:hypothetical protein